MVLIRPFKLNTAVDGFAANQCFDVAAVQLLKKCTNKLFPVTPSLDHSIPAQQAYKD